MQKVTQRIVFIADWQDEKKQSDSLYDGTRECPNAFYYQTVLHGLKSIFDCVICYHDVEQFIENIANHKSDIVISLWSGQKDRNRKCFIPAICESYHIHYIGADAFVQSLCQNKHLSKIYANSFGIKSAADLNITMREQIPLCKELKFPVIVKPNSEGGSNGISDYSLAMNYPTAYNMVENLYGVFNRDILVEEYIEGKELTIIIANMPDGNLFWSEQILAIDGKTDFKSEIYGYETKKLHKRKTSREIVNLISSEEKKKIQNLFLALGKVDYMRIDGRFNGNHFYLIELSPDANLSPKSSMGFAFQSHGYSYNDMLYSLIQGAINQFRY